jgi:hypothetical protein
MFKQNKQKSSNKLFLNKKAIARLAMNPQFAKVILGGGAVPSRNSSGDCPLTDEGGDWCTSHPTRPPEEG